jgi:glycerol-3-phosphate dehydrogenase subunit C
VASADFSQVIDACTLCDMCFMTKCPYVPPHAFAIDFPHLMLRHRAVAMKEGKVGFVDRQLVRTDRNGRLAGAFAPLSNWATATGNRLTRPALEKAAGIHRDAALPKFHRRTLMDRMAEPPHLNRYAAAYGRKAVIFATCFGNYNDPGIGEATRAVLAHNGVETEFVYPRCCGMPQLEQGDIAAVAEAAGAVSAALLPWVDKGYDVIALVASCALMLKFEWPLIVPENADLKRLAEATYDVSEFIVDIAARHGMAPGMKPLEGGVSVHLACHARAQNMGHKAAEMLRLIPDTKVTAVERCSGHGGTWGIKEEHFETALKVGRPTVKQVEKAGNRYLSSECPLAAQHLVQGLDALEGRTGHAAFHPIQLMALAYGLAGAP